MMALLPMVRDIIKLGLLCVLLVLPLELRLRVFQSSPYIVKGQKVILPANKTYVYVTHNSKKLDPVIYVKKNALGFRGPERPQNFHDYCSIIFMGGSSLAADNLTEGKTWIDDLSRMFSSDFTNVWINNAGFMGHSTVAHLTLLADYVVNIKPDIVVFFVGENEISLIRQIDADENIVRGTWHTSGVRSFLLSIMRNIDSVNLAVNLYQTYARHARPGAYRELDFRADKKIAISAEERQKRVRDYEQTILPVAMARVQKLVDICRANGIQPVFLTFTALYNTDIDPETGERISDFEVDTNRNAELSRELMGVINARIRGLRDQGVVVIDVDKKMPKSSRYFSDYFHFTNDGATEMAKAIYPELKAVVEKYSVVRKRAGNNKES